MRKNFINVLLKMSNGQEVLVVIATNDLERIPHLVEKNKVFYNRDEYNVVGFSVKEVKWGIELTPEQYEQELVYSDIDDEGQF